MPIAIRPARAKLRGPVRSVDSVTLRRNQSTRRCCGLIARPAPEIIGNLNSIVADSKTMPAAQDISLANIAEEIGTQLEPSPRPQAWLQALLLALKQPLRAASISVSAQDSGNVVATELRDMRNNRSRIVTRFHAAERFLQQAATELDGQPELAQLREQRLALLNHVEEAEGLYQQQLNQGEEGVATSGRDGPDVPLSFFSQEQRKLFKRRSLALLRQGDEDGLPESRLTQQLLRGLGRQLSSHEPGSRYLTRRILDPAEEFDAAISRAFAVMSEPGTSANERAWLSDLGSYLIDLRVAVDALMGLLQREEGNDKPEAAQATPEAAPAGGARNAGDGESVDLTDSNSWTLAEDDGQAAEAAPASEQRKEETASDDRFASLDIELEELEQAEPEAAQSSESQPSECRPEPTAEPETKSTPQPKPGTTRKPAPRLLDPKDRREAKAQLSELMQSWDSAEDVISEQKVLTQMGRILGELVDDEPALASLRQPLQAGSFMPAQRELESAVHQQRDDRQLTQALKGLRQLCEDIQTAYVQRLNELLGVPFFDDRDQRRELIARLVAHWQKQLKDADGGRQQRLAVAEKQCLVAFAKHVAKYQLPPACKAVLKKDIAEAESLEAALRNLRQARSGHPMTTLLRSQCKGFLEDVAIQFAFQQTQRGGWDMLLDTLSQQTPRSESELVAILSRKIDLFGVTAVHLNFLNPTKSLRLANFLRWLQAGYKISPQYSGKEEEDDLLAHIEWLITQILSMQYEEMPSGGNESVMDVFLREEQGNGYQVYSVFMAEIARRFEDYWNDYMRRKGG